MLHGQESEVFGHAGCQGDHKRPDATERVRWTIAMRPGKRAELDKKRVLGQLTDQLERLKASIRAKVEHPLRVIERELGM